MKTPRLFSPLACLAGSALTWLRLRNERRIRYRAARLMAIGGTISMPKPRRFSGI